MFRLSSLVLGIVIGGVLVFGSHHYHLLRTDDGFFLVPKTESTFSDAYVDIRSFTLKDWAEHRNLATALVKANKQDLMTTSTVNSLEDGLKGAMEGALEGALQGSLDGVKGTVR